MQKLNNKNIWITKLFWKNTCKINHVLNLIPNAISVDLIFWYNVMFINAIKASIKLCVCMWVIMLKIDKAQTVSYVQACVTRLKGTNILLGNSFNGENCVQMSARHQWYYLFDRNTNKMFSLCINIANQILSILSFSRHCQTHVAWQQCCSTFVWHSTRCEFGTPGRIRERRILWRNKPMHSIVAWNIAYFEALRVKCLLMWQLLN